MSTLFLPLLVLTLSVGRIRFSSFAKCKEHSRKIAQGGKLLVALLCAIFIATPGTLFAKDADSTVQPGAHFYLTTKESFACYSKADLAQHIKNLKMGNSAKAKQLQEDDLSAIGKCFSQPLTHLAKTLFVVIDVESASDIEGRIVGFNFAEKPNSPPSFFTLIKYVTPTPTSNSTDDK